MSDEIKKYICFLKELSILLDKYEVKVWATDCGYEALIDDPYIESYHSLRGSPISSKEVNEHIMWLKK